MIVVYDFEGNSFEYEVEWDYAVMRKILKPYSTADIVDLIIEFAEPEDIAEYLQGEDMLEMNRHDIVYMFEELVDFDVFYSYFEEEVKDMFENKAYEEYQNALDWEYTCEEIGYFMRR